MLGGFMNLCCVRRFLFLSSCAVFAVFAQGTGTIHGVVTDASGAVVPAATVSARHEARATTRTVQTDAQGEYVVPLLPVGTYTITVTGPGFREFKQQGVDLTSDQNVRVDARLELGNVADTITVNGEPPLVDSRSSVVGALIDSQRIVDLPLNGRNVVNLAALLPGTTSINAVQMFTGDRNGPTLSISGSRANENLFLFDGVQNSSLFRNTGLNFPPPDALQEVKVLTSNYDAEYGRNAGSVFNVVTKSGTNEIHGSVWEFLRNQDLNARNFFAPSRPQLIQNQFGATGGGPIRKNKLFAFLSYEGLRIRPAALMNGSYPLTAAERQGDFSNDLLTKVITDPLSGTPFPNNQIPQSRIDPVAAKVLSGGFMPLPNGPNGQYSVLWPLPETNDQGLARVDYNLGRNTIDGHMNYSRAWQTTIAALAASIGNVSGTVPSYGVYTIPTAVQSYTVGDTFIVTPALLNQARLSLDRLSSNQTPLLNNSLSGLGSNYPDLEPKILPTLTLSGRLTMQAAAPALIVSQSFQFSDSINWTHGEHTVKAGFELLKLRYIDDYTTGGNATFTGTFTGDSGADFLLGKAATFVVTSPETVPQEGLQLNTYYFVQDDWRIHPRLTLNLGLRYELPLPWVQPNNYWATLRPGEQSQVYPTAPVGMVFPGDPGVPRGLVQTDKHNFAPRVGFAWDLFGKGRTSVRGSYGIFYETINCDIVQNTDQPFVYSYTLNAPYSLSDPLRGLAPIPTTLNLKNPVFSGLPSLFYPDPNLVSPYVQQFNLNVQHELARNLAVQVGYAGKLGRKLLIGYATNPAVYAPGATLANEDARRILQGFSNNRVISSRSDSSYEALQVSVNRRFAGGFSLQGSYAFSRSIDNSSAFALGAVVPNVFDFHTQTALADFYAKHVFSASGIWDLPKLRTQPKVIRFLAGGWQTSGLLTMNSGMPINIVSGSDIALSGTNSQRPNVVGNPVISGNRSRGTEIAEFFNRSVFVKPAAGMYGDTGRNALLGPGYFDTDLDLVKSFPLPGREKLRLQFRAEFFNIFNSVNLASPNASLAAGPNMGLISNIAGNARVIQFALKLLY